jgi:Na+/H+-dicarboxylate symporter
MGRTAVNVTGQALVPTLVAKQQGILDIDRYNGGEDIEVLDAEREPLGAHPVPAE